MSSVHHKVLPTPDEYAEFYAGYVSLVPEGHIVELLEKQQNQTVALLTDLPAERHSFRYAPGKWTVSEVLGHMVDTERVFSYRALSFARGDKSPLPGMDQDDFMAGSNFRTRSLPDILNEYRHLRQANLSLFQSFDEETLGRTGIASDCRFTVRAILHIICGHELHHVQVLKDRYL